MCITGGSLLIRRRTAARAPDTSMISCHTTGHTFTISGIPIYIRYILGRSNQLAPFQVDCEFSVQLLTFLTVELVPPVCRFPRTGIRRNGGTPLN